MEETQSETSTNGTSDQDTNGDSGTEYDIEVSGSTSVRGGTVDGKTLSLSPRVGTLAAGAIGSPLSQQSTRSSVYSVLNGELNGGANVYQTHVKGKTVHWKSRNKETLKWSIEVPEDCLTFQVLKRSRLRIVGRILALSEVKKALFIGSEKSRLKSIHVSRIARTDWENAKVPFSKSVSLSDDNKQFQWPLDLYISTMQVSGRGSARLVQKTFIFRSKEDRKMFVAAVQSLNQRGRLPDLDHESETTSSCYFEFKPFHGEIENPLGKIEGVVLECEMSAYQEHKYASGALWLSNYRVFFSLYDMNLNGTYYRYGDIIVHEDGIFPAYVCIPLASLQSAKVEYPRLIITTKDLRTMTFVFDKSQKWLESFRIQLTTGKDHVYANFTIHHRLPPPPPPPPPLQLSSSEDDIDPMFVYNGWIHCYDPHVEFKAFCENMEQAHLRTEHPSLIAIRLFDQKISYSTCKTYPRYLIVPLSFDDRKVQRAASHRSSHRFPVARWVHPGNGSVLCRSSQPMAGLANHRSSLDEELLDEFAKSACGKKLYIVDARGRPAVLGNTLQGKGLEKSSDYNNAEIELCQIGNIHTMRTSILGLMAALEDPNEAKYLEKLDDSNWLRHIEAIVSASVRVAEILHKRECSVLVHCSDGFDRTPQLVCISKLLLDPHYRTLEGFCELVESEWCAFGHKFKHRCGDRSSQEYSPIFIQFLDAVYNIMSRRTCQFEFNEDLLLYLSKHAFSARFGTFLTNCEYDRVTQGINTKTESIWTDIFENRIQFINSNYEMFPQPIWPVCSPKVVRLWERYYYRDHPHLIPM